MRNLAILYFTVWFGGIITMISKLFIDPESTPKWYFAFYFGIIGLIFLLSCIIKNKKPHFTDISFVITLCASTQALYGSYQWLAHHNVLDICANFDNVAGLSSLLVFSLPFGFYSSRSTNSTIRYISLVSLVINTMCIILTTSRAAIISGLIIAFFILINKLKSKRLIITGIFISLLVVISFSLYSFKKDSADGRVLIWTCTYNIISKSPWIGHGTYGFLKNYMNEQAEYFRNHPESNYSVLADDVKVPFNEFLHLWVNHGIIALALVIVLSAFCVKLWRTRDNDQSLISIACLLSIVIFSMFSYPFRYPHTICLSLISLLTLIYNSKVFSMLIIRNGIIIMITCCLIASIPITSRMLAEIKWCKVANRSLCGMTEKMLPEYKSLYSELQSDPLFLYNYAAELNVVGLYKESLAMCEECENMMSDYFLELLKADNLKHLKHYDEAKTCLQKASNMCPNRFIPLFELFKLYEIMGESVLMNETGQALLKKNVKIHSNEIVRIKKYVETKLNNKSTL